MSDEKNATPINENICNEIRNGKPDVVTVPCNYRGRNPQLRGRYVTIRQKKNADDRHLLQFCEVRVMSCRPGTWGYNSGSSGDDCAHVCDGCRNASETCGVSDGHCYSGCRVGFCGCSCDEQCDCSGGDSCQHSRGLCARGKYDQQSQIVKGVITSNHRFY